MDCITGSMTQIQPTLIQKLFPHLSPLEVQSLLRGTQVDILLGLEHPSFHPSKVERAPGAGDLWLWKGWFGSCVGGRHPEIVDCTQKSDSLFTVNHVRVETIQNTTSHELEYCKNRVAAYENGDDSRSAAEVVYDRVQACDNIQTVDLPSESVNDGVRVAADETLSESVTHVVDELVTAVIDDTPTLPSASHNVYHQGLKTTVLSEENRFFELEALGTVINPKCGDCKCSECPIPGSKYTHKEQQEYDAIQDNLYYNSDEKCYYTKYPWNLDRSVLPKNDKIAFQCLLSFERTLSQDPELADDFCRQIDEMVNRKSARILSEDELNDWQGDYYYLPVLGVKGKKWLRVVFDASRRQGGFPSLNDCLAKGPDRFMNNLLSVIVGFRNGRVGCAGDISKFHNRVRLVPEDTHMQRFLWRDMEVDKKPNTYVVEVNNFGVTAANCIATCALFKSADLFSGKYPIESKELKEQIYIDDELFAAPDRKAAVEKTNRIDEITVHASMPNKGWTYTGDKSKSTVPIGGGDEIDGDKVLGLLWNPETDTFTFVTELNLLHKNGQGAFIDTKVTTVEEMNKLSDICVTRRAMLRNVSKTFDPAGWWCPVVLQSKILLRESWSDSVGKDLGWDDPLPDELSASWLSFLESLLKLKEFQFPRSLWPEEQVRKVFLYLWFSLTVLRKHLVLYPISAGNYRTVDFGRS